MNLDLMTLEEMKHSAKIDFLNDSLGTIVIGEIWKATAEICKRLDLLHGSSLEEEAKLYCRESPAPNKCLFEFNGLNEDPTCTWCGRT
jgi:hypothetical protein